MEPSSVLNFPGKFNQVTTVVDDDSNNKGKLVTLDSDWSILYLADFINFGI